MIFRQPAIRLIFICIISFCFYGCGDEAMQPIYVKINEPEFDILTEQGTDYQISHSYFMFHRTSLLGGFQYGNEIPVLADPQDEIQIFPGIRKNGLRQQPAIYDMMSRDIVLIDALPGETFEFTPTYSYLPNVQFRLNEDFEGGTAFSLDLDENSSTRLIVTENVGYNNSAGGVMTVDEDNPLIEVAWSVGLTDFPISGDVIIELTYKNDTNLGVGFFGTSTSGSLEFIKLFLFPSDTLTKVYIDIGPEMRESRLDNFHVMFSYQHDGTSTSNQAIIDDVKLLHLQ